MMVANIGPADWNFDETITTLRYANRAKNIKNKPKINEDPKDALLREFQVCLQSIKCIKTNFVYVNRFSSLHVIHILINRRRLLDFVTLWIRKEDLRRRKGGICLTHANLPHFNQVTVTYLIKNSCYYASIL